MNKESTILDTDMLMRRVAGDKQLLQELVVEFRNSYPILLKRIEIACLETKDLTEIERLAHNLKNSLQVFFKGEIITKIYALEVVGRNNNISKLQEVFEEFQNSIKSAESVFQELYNFSDNGSL